MLTVQIMNVNNAIPPVINVRETVLLNALHAQQIYTYNLQLVHLLAFQHVHKILINMILITLATLVIQLV